MNDHRLKQALARLFRSPKASHPPQADTVELRLTALEKRIDTTETRLWAMLAAVAIAELVRTFLVR